MLFKGVILFWRNAFEYPLSRMGKPGKSLAVVLYPVLVYVPGMALAALAYLIYPPVVSLGVTDRAK